MITWIKGQNSSGKTIKIQEMLGAKIEKPFLDSPIFTVALPNHILIHFKSSNIHIFLTKEKHLKKEYNKIFRLYDRFLSQSKLIAQREERIKELSDKIKKIKDTNERIQNDYKERVHNLQQLIKEENKLNAEQEIIESNPIYKTYTDLLDTWIKEKNSNESVQGWNLQSWKDLKNHEEKNKSTLEPLNNRWNEIMEEKRMKFISRNFKNELETEKNNPPELYETHHDEWTLDSLKKLLQKTIKNTIQETDILSLIEIYHSHKTVWIDGKPSSDFNDFYNLITMVNRLHPSKLFISHCGNEIWFKGLKTAKYNVNHEQVSVDLENLFNQIYIEVPSVDNNVTLTDNLI